MSDGSFPFDNTFNGKRSQDIKRIASFCLIVNIKSISNVDLLWSPHEREDPFSQIIGMGHAFLKQEGRKRIRFILNMADKLARITAAVTIQRNKSTEPGIK